MPLPFESVGRLASPTDNVAIAIRRLDAGTAVQYGDSAFVLPYTVLEGHRFAVQALQPGDMLTSWAQPFGNAVNPIRPGDYVCNAGALRELARHAPDFPLPPQPNFADQIAPFVFDEAAFRASPPLTLYDQPLTFEGYRRPGSRGVGTRNMIVLLGTSSLTGGFVRALETQLKPLAAQVSNIDGIVAAAHTEGGSDQFNNGELLLRTLAGFITNPNVGAVLILDRGTESINNDVLRAYMEQHGYPLGDVLHQFMSLTRSFQHDLDAASAIVQAWVQPVSAMQRTTQPVSELKIGLQCGGSDAFSGISGNPLAAWVAKEVVLNGGAANLAETDELIGAESYILSNIRDLDTARKFLSFLDRFKTWTGWHGQSAEGNPSGGNLYRGLYNIYLKSLGAAAKRHPDMRVDAVIDYGEPMREPGFYFMDSPGNDLESVAGQVAAGCNMIIFVTGNGSITNFPYVPTIKVVTTTKRYELLSNEMDINAGAYLDGTPFEEVGQAALQYTISAASGQLTAGEHAGHAQVQIWRDWRQTGTVNLEDIRLVQNAYTREPIPIRLDVDVPNIRFRALRVGGHSASEQVGLILPTSLCSGQIARMAVEALNDQRATHDFGVSRFVTLIHTEGCGSSSGRELNDTLIGYLTHPMVRYALLLEHGCEKTHNGYLHQLMDEHGLDPAAFGWASVQLDGGIQNVMHRMTDWFEARNASHSEPVTVGLEAVSVGLVAHGNVDDQLAGQLAMLTRVIVAGGGSVVVAENDPFVLNAAYQQALGIGVRASLGYAQTMKAPGFHIMEMPSRHWGEKLTGLGACGIELIVAHVGQQPMSGHPLIPTLHVTSNSELAAQYAADLDAVLNTHEAGWQPLLDLMIATLEQDYSPRVRASGNTEFLITRGLLGVSL